MTRTAIDLTHARQRHSWRVTPAEGRAIQDELRAEVFVEDDLGPEGLAGVHTVAGVDVGFEDGGATTRAAVAVLGYPSLEPRCHALARRPTGMPYIPGLLSFREIPAVLDALERLEEVPDVLLCDGQGIAHPRRLGIATHLGLVTDLPSAGVAKSLLVGRYEGLPDERGAWVPLTHRGEVVGAALRSRAGVKPIFVSPGHRVSLATALTLVLGCLTRYKLPETTRAAHRLASG